MAWSGATFTRTNGTYSGESVWASDLSALVKIVASRHDTHDQDLATGINACINKNGANAAAADVSWGGFKIVSLGAATAAGDAVRYEQVIGVYQPLHASLTSIAGLTTAADKGVYTSASNVYVAYSLTAGGRALNGVAGTANTFPYFSSSNTVTLGATTTAGLAMMSAATAAAQLALLPVAYDLVVAISDETTAITTGVAKVSIRAPRAFTITGAKASLATASSSGLPAFDINKNAVSIFSTTITIDATELTSVTAVTPAVITTTAVAADDLITFDIDAAGTGAKGAKITLLCTVP